MNIVRAALSRRGLLRNSASVAGAVTSALLLSACGGGAATASQASVNATAIAAAAQVALADVGTSTGMSAANVGTLTNYLTVAQTAAKSISTALTPTASDVQALEAAVSALAVALPTIPGVPPTVTLAVQTANVLLPAILTAAGIGTG